MSQASIRAVRTQNSIRQLDTDRRHRDVAIGRVAPQVGDMRLGEAKRFNLAVMHVDMDDFTGTTSSLANEDKLRLLNIYLSEFTAVVRDYDGFVEKYVGDGITALFGAGRGESEAVGNAIECAMTMHAENERAMGRYLQRIGLPRFTCSIGMDYGVIWVARVGVQGMNMLTLVGNEASIAKDLEELARDGGTMVGRRFRDALSPRRREFCERQPPGKHFGWKTGKDPYPYYEYCGQWVFPNG